MFNVRCKIESTVKVAQDACSHYVCIYLKSMHKPLRLIPTKCEIFKF